MTNQQRHFLYYEFFSLTLMATVQRGRVYVPALTEKERIPFQDSLRGALDGIALSYRSPVGDESHVKNICALADRLTALHPRVLRGQRFRVGSAQKTLNLYLKYLWCIGEIPAPPHCPFDYQIISRLPNCRDIKWTEFDDVETYKRLVEAARTKANGQQLPEWELEFYNRHA